MSEKPLETPSQVMVALREFSNLANAIGMPDSERRSVLGLTAASAHHWEFGPVEPNETEPPALVRRLGYALPLMRRMAANVATRPAGSMNDPSHSVAN